MAKITRALQKIFGSTAGASEIAQFGSLANSTPNFTTDPTIIQALTQYDGGWSDAVIGNNSPALEDVNALDYLFSYQLAYIMQTGVPEWDASTIYFIGSIVSDGFGSMFISITNNNTGNALTDSTKWYSAGGMTTNANGVTLTVTSGKTYFQPNYIIPTGVTWTVNSGGYLMSIGPTIVNGTLIINGTSRTL